MTIFPRPVFSGSPTPGIDRFTSILFAIYVLVLPIGHTVALRNLAFFTLAGLTLWLALRGRIKLVFPLVWPWLIYTVVAAFSLTYAVDPAYSLGEIKTEIGYGFLLLVLAATWITNVERFMRLVWVLIAGNLFLVASSFYYAVPHLLQGTAFQVGALNIGVGKFSTYLVMIVPFIFAQIILMPKPSRMGKMLLALLIAANIIAVYFTGNRAGVVSLIIEAALLSAMLLWRRPPNLSIPKILAAFMLAVLLLGSLSINQVANRTPDTPGIGDTVTSDVRWGIWHDSLKNIAALPYSGGGFGRDAFKLLNPDYPKSYPYVSHAHNTLLNMGVQMGLPGIAVWLLLMVAVGRSLWIPLATTLNWGGSTIYAAAGIVMLVGLLVKLQTDDFFNRDIALLFWLLVGALFSVHRSSR